MDASKKVTSKGSVGGRSATATSGKFTPGPQLAATGNFRGGVGHHADLRGGNAAKGGYNQGPTVTAQTGGSKPGHQADLRGGTCTTGGYNQGAMHAGRTK